MNHPDFMYYINSEQGHYSWASFGHTIMKARSNIIKLPINQ